MDEEFIKKFRNLMEKLFFSSEQEFLRELEKTPEAKLFKNTFYEIKALYANKNKPEIIKALDDMAETFRKPENTSNFFGGMRFSDLFYNSINDNAVGSIPTYKIKYGYNENGKLFVDINGLDENTPDDYKIILYRSIEAMFKQPGSNAFGSMRDNPELLNILKEKLNIEEDGLGSLVVRNKPVYKIDDTINADKENFSDEFETETLFDAESYKDAQTFRLISEIPGIKSEELIEARKLDDALLLKVKKNNAYSTKRINLEEIVDSEKSRIDWAHFNLDKYEKNVKNGIVEIIYRRRE